MEENNKIIAEFMGLDTEVFKSGKVNYYYYDKVSKQEIFLEAHELSYNVSWDWLMPVIKKCKSLDNTFDVEYEVVNEDYHAVVQFIKDQND